MNPIISATDLRDIQLLAGLDDYELDEFIRHCETAICPPETIIIAQGDEERALVIVLDGAVQVRLAVPHVGEAVVSELPARCVFGEVSFFHATPHSATVFCVESARLLRLQYSKFEQLKSGNNRLALVLG